MEAQGNEEFGLYNTIKAGKGVWELAPRKIFKMHFLQRWEMPLRKFPELHIRTSVETFGGGGGGVVRLKLPVFTWLVNCSIFTDHYSVQYFKAMFFS